MNYQGLIKTLELPGKVLAPTILQYEDIEAKPLTRQDLDADLEGVNSSIETIQNTRGGSWPSEPLNKDFDLLDLAWHEREFRDGNSFAYVLYTKDGAYIGCFYLYGIGMRTPLNDETISYEVDASWWVTTKMFGNGYYEKVFAALQSWLANDFGFTKVKFSNRSIPE